LSDRTCRVVHDQLPVLPVEHVEDGGKGCLEGIEIHPGANSVLHVVLVSPVELDPMGEELHAEDSVSEEAHEEEH